MKSSIPLLASRKAVSYLGVIILFTAISPAAEILLISDQPNSPESHELELATRFYGLEVKTVLIQPANQEKSVLDEIKQPGVIGVMIDADSLRALPRRPFLAALKGHSTRQISLLIFGITASTDSRELKTWSDNAVSICSALQMPAGGRFLVGSDRLLAGALAGQEIPSFSSPSCTFSVTNRSTSEPVLSISQRPAWAPIYVKSGSSSAPVLFLPRFSSTTEIEAQADFVKNFARLMPLMLFVRYAAGEYAWHSPYPMANLTIDDPWLTEPYGYLNYHALLSAMERHNFHTTIAFIPWNFDRTDPTIAALFRAHSDRYSISVHGNNHDHKEFDDYSSVPLLNQIVDIRQAIARMERFKVLSGVSYDPIMVFPHSIAPEKTLAELKRYNFLATVNSDDVPMGSNRPTDPLFSFRSFTADFADFPSFRRYTVEVPLPKSTIAIESFLGNPVLFYCHAQVFSNGETDVENVVDAVNEMEPRTKWRGLGDIARRTYLLRSRADGAEDVLVLGNDVILQNDSAQKRLYFVRKRETSSRSIMSLSVDERKQPFKEDTNGISFGVVVPANSSRRIRIQYMNDFTLSDVGTSKGDPRVALLRRASDFRDITLPRYAAGRKLVRFYYRHQLDSIEPEMEKQGTAAVVLILLCSLFLIQFRRRRQKNVLSPNNRMEFKSSK